MITTKSQRPRDRRCRWVPGASEIDPYRFSVDVIDTVKQAAPPYASIIMRPRCRLRAFRSAFSARAQVIGPNWSGSASSRTLSTMRMCPNRPCSRDPRSRFYAYREGHISDLYDDRYRLREWQWDRAHVLPELAPRGRQYPINQRAGLASHKSCTH